MDRLLVAGDVHGNTLWTTSLIQRAGARGIDLLQLGDFGVWSDRSGKKFLDVVSHTATKKGVNVFFIDGNHEDYDWLREFATWNPDEDGFIEIRPNVKWIPRGTRWTWGDTTPRRFGTLGGAFSVDHYDRTQGVDWWENEEELQPEDVGRLGTAPIDVLVSHDAPFGGGPQMGQLEIGPTDTERSTRTMRLLRQAVETTQPDLVLHGHWHIRHSVNLMFDSPHDPSRRWARIEGLSSDIEGNGGSYGILDLKTLEFKDGSGK